MSRKVIFITIGVGALVMVLFGGYQVSRYMNQSKADAERTITELTQDVNRLMEENDTLTRELDAERGRMKEFAQQIEDITGEIGILDRLAKTDKELLQKYSKTFFLNEHYRPSELIEISSRFRFPENEDIYIHRDVWPFLRAMIEDAEEARVSIAVKSAFRSFDEQKSVKAVHLTTYGTAANQFSADQGYSEHQLGTTVDFTTPELQGALDGFEKTKAYTWLVKNAYKYGFVLSYPEGNSYYQFEPWHWRFVGTSLARRLYRNGESFYGLDQREIDEYLVDLFE